MKKSIYILIALAILSCKENKPKEFENNLELKDSIVKIVERKVIEKPKLSPKLKLSNVSIKNRGYGTRAASVYGSGNTIYFTISNKTGIGVKSVKLIGEYKYKGRSLSYKEEITYSFRKGLEPNEIQKVGLRPNTFSKWNKKVTPGDKGEFNLKVISFKNYDDKVFF